MNGRCAEITVFTKSGGPLSKHIELIDGRIANDSSACQMAKGSARRVRIDLDNITALADLINKLTAREAYGNGCLLDGLPDRVTVTTVEKLDEARKSDPTVIARTRDYLVYAAGEPAIALLDIDLKGVPDSAKSLINEAGGIWSALRAVLPTLATVARVTRPSTSAGLRNRKTGEIYPDSGGFHAVIAVADGGDIPRFLTDLHDRLWLAGYGWGIASAAGSFLERSLVDKACGSPESLIFEGQPIIHPPLEQAPRPAVAHEGGVLDTRTACPPLTDTEKDELERLKEAERDRLKPQSDEARANWSASHIKRMVAAGVTQAEARSRVDRWIDGQALSGDFPLPFDDPTLAGATVADVLANLTKFVGKTLSDPFEGPAYGRGKAIVYQRANGSLFVHSFAHGGARYELEEAQRPDPDLELDRLRAAVEIDRLARLSLFDYARERKKAAKDLKLDRLSDLDKLVERRRAEIKREAYPGDNAPGGLNATLAELNKDYSAIKIGGKTRVLWFEDTVHHAGGQRYIHRLPNYLSFQDFRNYYLNRYCIDANGAPFAVDGHGKPLSIGDWWLAHPKRNTYPSVTFLPRGEKIVEGAINLWTGFGVQPIKGDWGLMRRHIREVLSAGDEAVDRYVLNWLADCVQYPNRQAEVALVFLGGFGTGRGILGRAMCRIFGQHGRHISSTEHMTGKFNAHLQMCCFLFADEAFAPQDRRAEGVWKRLITEDTLTIEPKGVDPLEVPNRLHVMTVSNHEWAVPAGEKERRVLVQAVAKTHQQDEAYFTPLYEQMADGGLEAMLYDLLDHDIGQWRPRKIVRTKALGQQQEESLEPIDAWFFSLLEAGVLPAAPAEPPEAVSTEYEEEIEETEEATGLYIGTRTRKRKVKRDGLFEHACKMFPKIKALGPNRLFRYLGDRERGGGSHTWIKVNRGPKKKRGWRFPLLAEARDRWVERFPETVWPEGSPADWTSGDHDENED